MGITKTNKVIVDSINGLLAKYGTMTLRQVYYQLVPLGYKYAQIQYILDKARRTGLVDLDQIVDRSRPSYGFNTWNSTHDLLEYYSDNFKLDYWASASYQVQIWSEKDALSQILNEEASKYRVPVRVTRGFLSTSDKHEWSGEDLRILYFGDFDPSGLLMDKNLEFGNYLGNVLEFENIRRVALTWDYLKDNNLPSVPVKEKDNRAKAYKKLYGNRGWELDAMDPALLRRLVNDSITELLPFNLDQKQKEEQALRDELKQLQESRK